MLIVVSPAKNLDFETQPVINRYSEAELLDHAEQLIAVCKTLSPADVASLMSISDKLSGLNVARFNSWSQPFTVDNAKQAILAFNGDVYTGLDASSFTSEDFAYAQDNMRILSGLYGLLKPLDLMQPYRLEMGTRLANSRGKNLYEFWGNIITDKLNEVLAKNDNGLLLNLASTEYFKAVKAKDVAGDIITPAFKDKKNGQYKMISFFAKKARGMMARYVIQNKVNSVDKLLAFDAAGYQYNEAMSKPHAPVFTREEQ